MPKDTKNVPCPEPDCVLLKGHKVGCCSAKVVKNGDGWDLLLANHEGELIHRLELTEEPSDVGVTAAASMMVDLGRGLPGARVMNELPELRETVYGDQTDE